MTVPEAALAAAAEACPFVNRDALQRALEAAAPHLAASIEAQISVLTIHPGDVLVVDFDNDALTAEEAYVAKMRVVSALEGHGMPGVPVLVTIKGVRITAEPASEAPP